MTLRPMASRAPAAAQPLRRQREAEAGAERGGERQYAHLGFIYPIVTS